MSSPFTLEKTSKIYVAGHAGMVGSALVRKLRSDGFDNLILRSRTELDLSDQAAVARFFTDERPDIVFLAAAKVGGIWANSQFPAEFIYENLMIETNTLHNAFRCGVKKLLFLGSSCIYPRLAPQPIQESSLLSGPLEPTNEAYAIAKIAGVKLCESYNEQYGTRFIPVMPTNLFGPGDNFDLENSHVLPALLRKFHEAKEAGEDTVTVWGTGRPRREFLYVDDLADACIFLMKEYRENELINIGVGEDIPIKSLAEMIQKVVGFHGDILFDESKPDGTPRKLLDVSAINKLGWRAKTGLRQGLSDTYKWYVKTEAARAVPSNQ